MILLVVRLSRFDDNGGQGEGTKLRIFSTSLETGFEFWLTRRSVWIRDRATRRELVASRRVASRGTQTDLSRFHRLFDLSDWRVTRQPVTCLHRFSPPVFPRAHSNLILLLAARVQTLSISRWNEMEIRRRARNTWYTRSTLSPSENQSLLETYIYLGEDETRI